jgi:hypothetical protein
MGKPRDGGHFWGSFPRIGALSSALVVLRITYFQPLTSPGSRVPNSGGTDFLSRFGWVAETVRAGLSRHTDRKWGFGGLWRRFRWFPAWFRGCGFPVEVVGGPSDSRIRGFGPAQTAEFATYGVFRSGIHGWFRLTPRDGGLNPDWSVDLGRLCPVSGPSPGFARIRQKPAPSLAD